MAYVLPPIVVQLRIEHPGIELGIVASTSARDLRRPLPIPIWLATYLELRISRRSRVVFDVLAEGLRRSADG